MEIVLILVFSVAIWILYHKLFDVVYFDLSAGILKEIGVSFFGGLILTALTLMYWWITVILIALIALVLIMKYRRKEQKIIVTVCAVIIAILVAVTGVSFNNKLEKEPKESANIYNYMIERVC